MAPRRSFRTVGDFEMCDTEGLINHTKGFLDLISVQVLSN
jgi:hypothetical protein